MYKYTQQLVLITKCQSNPRKLRTYAGIKLDHQEYYMGTLLDSDLWLVVYNYDWTKFYLNLSLVITQPTYITNDHYKILSSNDKDLTAMSLDGTS